MCRATKLCCFRCMIWFEKVNLESCHKCGDWKCPACGSCLCSLSVREQKIAIAYMATYENLLRELTGESYDFGRHRNVLAGLKVRRRALVRAEVGR